MAQHDFVIDNQSFPSFRSDLNSVLQAIVSNNSGTSAPSTTFANQIWYDSNANILYIRNEDNDANIPLLQFDQSADVAATLATVIDILDASGTDQAGTALTIRAGAGTGTGAGGSIIFETADGAGSTGSSVNAHATRVTITDDGKVGVGTATPAHELTIQTTSADPTLRIHADTDSSPAPAIELMRGANDTFGADIFTDYRMSNNGGNLIFEKAASSTTTEVARLDANARLLVGKTTNVIGTAGHTLQADGFVSHTRDGAHPFSVNRLSDDGELINFFKDGTGIGSITTRSGLVSSIVLDPRSTGAGLTGSTRRIMASDQNGASLDNAVDLGQSSVRFDDIFATNTSIIGTSDANEKQQIASLTDAEITAAKALSKLFKTFKWNSAVESKGDNARTHTGHIAQEVQSAMTDAGLDATKYAFWCSDTWWETQTEVPAVEADEENGIEAKDAYTRTDTYETAEEAPEGATERTRLGIRYPELLAFIGAATEQRLADIETRLTALEG